MVSFEIHPLDPMTDSSIHLIDDRYVVRLRVPVRLDFHIEITFGLEVRDQVSLSFSDQVAINGVLLIDRNQPLDRSFPNVRPSDSNRKQRPALYLKVQVGAVCLAMVVR